MRSGAIVCFVLAAITTAVAIGKIANGPERIENLVGYAVGTLLVPIAFLIAAIVLWGKSKK
jgi:hypothetical protein